MATATGCAAWKYTSSGSIPNSRKVPRSTPRKIGAEELSLRTPILTFFPSPAAGAPPKARRSNTPSSRGPATRIGPSPRHDPPRAAREGSAGMNLQRREEVGNLEGRRLCRVRPVDDVGLDRGRQFTADRPGRGLRGVCRAHEIPKSLDGVVAFEDHRDAGPGRHEVG